MIHKETAYVTVDDYKNIYGEDLRYRLRANDNESNQAENFIAMVTSHLKNWVNDNTFRRLDYDHLTEYQSDQWCRAILAQVYYCLHEGAKALGLSSGIDDERGVIIDPDVLVRSEVCSAAVDYLSNAGLLNFVIKHRPRGFCVFDSVGNGGPSPAPSPAPKTLGGIGYTEDD